jgi:hypothetical protein
MPCCCAHAGTVCCVHAGTVCCAHAGMVCCAHAGTVCCAALSVPLFFPTPTLCPLPASGPLPPLHPLLPCSLLPPPLPSPQEVIELVEDITLAYLTEVSRRASVHVAARGEQKVTPEDVMFVMRKVGASCCWGVHLWLCCGASYGAPCMGCSLCTVSAAACAPLDHPLHCIPYMPCQQQALGRTSCSPHPSSPPPAGPPQAGAYP